MAGVWVSFKSLLVLNPKLYKNLRNLKVAGPYSVPVTTGIDSYSSCTAKFYEIAIFGSILIENESVPYQIMNQMKTSDWHGNNYAT